MAVVFHGSGQFCLDDACLPPALSIIPHRTTRSTEISVRGHEGGGDCNVEIVWGGIQGNMLES